MALRAFMQDRMNAQDHKIDQILQSQATRQETLAPLPTAHLPTSPAPPYPGAPSHEQHLQQAILQGSALGFQLNQHQPIQQAEDVTPYLVLGATVEEKIEK